MHKDRVVARPLLPETSTIDAVSREVSASVPALSERCRPEALAVGSGGPIDAPGRRYIFRQLEFLTI